MHGWPSVKRDKTGARQLGLPFGVTPAMDRAHYAVSPANSVALGLIEMWPSWPDPVLLLTGPPASGKSHLANIWAQKSGARSIPAKSLALMGDGGLGASGPVVVEAADEIGPGETRMFHLLNLVREQKGWLLMTARSQPDNWGLATPDLLSRLRLAPSAAIAAPDDQLLRQVLQKGFADRQLAVEHGVADFIVARMERSFAAAEELVALLDAEALARQGAVTRQLVSHVLEDRYGQDDLFDLG